MKLNHLWLLAFALSLTSGSSFASDEKSEASSTPVETTETAPIVDAPAEASPAETMPADVASSSDEPAASKEADHTDKKEVKAKKVKRAKKAKKARAHASKVHHATITPEINAALKDQNHMMTSSCPAAQSAPTTEVEVAVPAVEVEQSCAQ